MQKLVIGLQSKTETRETLTQAETDRKSADSAEHAANANARASKKTAILARLGITEDELSILLNN